MARLIQLIDSNTTSPKIWKKSFLKVIIDLTSFRRTSRSQNLTNEENNIKNHSVIQRTNTPIPYSTNLECSEESNSDLHCRPKPSRNYTFISTFNQRFSPIHTHRCGHFHPATKFVYNSTIFKLVNRLSLSFNMHCLLIEKTTPIFPGRVFSGPIVL